MKERFKEETYMCVINEQDSQFSGSHWVIVYQDKKKTYFKNSLVRNFTYYGFQLERPASR